MGSLPIPGEMYINDFPDKSLYTVIRENHTVGNYDGLPNEDEDGRHIAFLYGADIQNGDMLSAEYKRSITVVSTDIDTYNGKPSIIKAYY